MTLTLNKYFFTVFITTTTTTTTTTVTYQKQKRLFIVHIKCTEILRGEVETLTVEYV